MPSAPAPLSPSPASVPFWYGTNLVPSGGPSRAFAPGREIPWQCSRRETQHLAAELHTAERLPVSVQPVRRDPESTSRLMHGEQRLVRCADTVDRGRRCSAPPLPARSSSSIPAGTGTGISTGAPQRRPGDWRRNRPSFAGASARSSRGKRQQIGAHAIIAVSESAFSAPAIDTARRYGIEIRNLEDVSNVEEVKELFSGLHVIAEMIRCHMFSYTIRLPDGRDITTDEIDEAALAATAASSTGLIHTLTDAMGEPFRPRAILLSADTSDVRPDGNAVRKRLTLTCDPNQVFVRLKTGLAAVGGSTYTLTIGRNLHLSTSVQFFAMASPESRSFM